jgi:hypothetical protein
MNEKKIVEEYEAGNVEVEQIYSYDVDGNMVDDDSAEVNYKEIVGDCQGWRVTIVIVGSEIISARAQ